MTRIVAGVFGGRRLTAPSGQQTRPTSDRVREALFSSLESLYGGDLRDLRFADLYAGSGAVGLEALSRGASDAVFVESDPRTAKIVRDNIATLGVTARTQVLTSKVTTAVAGPPPGGAFDVIFADPPYAVGEDEVAAVLAGLAENGWLAPDAVVVVERSRRSPEPSWVQDITGERSRRYGETTLWYGRAVLRRPESGEPAPQEAEPQAAEGMAQ
ncbi:MAG: 16S rRNA (guanine(966)-N(2))-methyltransferase RsmD [Hamadaea sp.]|nr:16S rRNA (guanine(966)-N(2))-methyltransferase RsmD [Hamadaea sp.]